MKGPFFKRTKSMKMMNSHNSKRKRIKLVNKNSEININKGQVYSKGKAKINLTPSK